MILFWTHAAARSIALIALVEGLGKRVHGSHRCQPRVADTAVKRLHHSNTREGYLTKEPLHGHLLSSARRRFFVLTGSVLEWSEHRGGALHGHMFLSDAELSRSGDALELSRKGERLVMRGESLQEWEES